MPIKLSKRDRTALIKKSGLSISDDYLRQCLAGTQQISCTSACAIVDAWAKIREAIQPIYGDVPKIDLFDLIARRGVKK